VADQLPAMIPPVKLGLLALGLAGWPMELESGTQVSHGGFPSYAFSSSLPFSQPKVQHFTWTSFRGQVNMTVKS
jgi:hypothetical protein